MGILQELFDPPEFVRNVVAKKNMRLGILWLVR